MPFLGRSPDIGAISDDSVTSAKIVNATIVAADLADDVLTVDKGDYTFTATSATAPASVDDATALAIALG